MGTQGLFLVGTGASSGKTLISRALCRLARRRGVALQPFKAVSIVERPVEIDGRTLDLSMYLLGVAAGQDDQATARSCTFAAREVADGFRLSTVTGEDRGTVPLLCRDQLDWAAVDADHYDTLVHLLRIDLTAAARQPVLVEGSASPTDAPDRDLGNADTWRVVQLPIVLVASAQRGGCAAAAVGTLRLLPPDMRLAVRGFMVNGVRHETLGRAWGERISGATGVPCLGIVPRLSIYAGLGDRGADLPVVGSWDEETDLVADRLEELWDPVRQVIEIG